MKHKRENGSTMVEVIVAMVILAFLITGLNTCVLSLIKTNVASKELSVATSKGYSLFEQLRRTDYSAIVTNSDVVNSKYIRSWTVTSDSLQKKIDVTICWPTVTKNHAIQLSTIIARP